MNSQASEPTVPLRALVELPIERFNDTVADIYPPAYREVIDSNG